MDRTILNDIQAVLLQPTTKTGIDLIIELIQKIQDITCCGICSLWSINSNDYNENRFKSTSLIYRQVSNSICYDFIDKEDFVHDMGRCFINDVVKSIISNKYNYYECDVSGCCNHRSKKCIDNLHLCYFVGIPIYDHDNTSKISAILKLSYQIKPNIDCWDEISVIIGSFLSLSLYRNHLLKEQSLIKLLMDNYRNNCKTGKNIKALLNPIIKNILPLFCKCQGISFFIWDSYQNRFNLLETTGIKGITDIQDVFYQLGEGLTGLAGMRKRTLIYNSLEEERVNSDHKEKWIEETLDKGETMMIVPILCPSGDSTIGLLRFVNKVNFANEKFIDYFNDKDVDLISFASNYIALLIDYMLRETSQNDFITKLSHEFYTPALSIHKTADQIKRYKDDEEFMKTRFQSYIQDIIYYAEFQQWQATTNLYLSKNRLDLPFDKRYRLTEVLLKNIITKSKSIAIPIARKVKVKFDNIKVYATPRRLAVIIEGLDEKTADEVKIVKGPIKNVAFDEAGNLTKAGEGFARKNNLSASDLYVEDNYVHAKIVVKGMSIAELLQENVPSIFMKLQGAHFMRWGYNDEKFSRPIKWIVSISEFSIS